VKKENAMPGLSEASIRPMEYPILAGGAASVIETADAADPGARVRELEARLSQREKQFSEQVEAATWEAIEKARETARGQDAAWRTQCAGELAHALADFKAHRDEYLGRVEQEVVRLALAIAERILHREANMDPLLLAGAVRVALGQLAESTEVRLRVAAGQHAMWAEMLRLMPGLPLRPDVVADPELQACEAMLETNLGRVDLGVRAQIAEIERGFFDLLEARGGPKPPGVRPAGSPDQGR
jgi:flagellar assembly protein FliH